ncbi:MAG TPA: sulfite exporter TauE/SafE family protein [Patescibacteria group bacterium]
MSTKKNLPSRSFFYVNGLHCASCEILIEKRLIKLDQVDLVDVSLSRGTVVLEYNSAPALTVADLNGLFKEDGYEFSRTPFKTTRKAAVDSACPVLEDDRPNPYFPLIIAALFIFGFTALSRTGFANLVSVNSSTSLPVFVLFGLLAGFSSCAALVGGIVLSLSKQWLSLYNQNDSVLTKSQPHLLFNTGRILGYALFGAVLGLIGNFFHLSPVFTAFLILTISALMIFLGLQMIGVKALKNFQVRLPKSLTGKIADESNFKGRLAPFLMGALTFFLPCGFTITAQALALSSGNPLQGALIMGLFALGTAPGLLLIGLSSVKLYSNPRLSRQFSVVAGLLVLFFAFFNINSQLSVLGVGNFYDLVSSSSSSPSVSAGSAVLPPIVNGKQVVNMTVSAQNGYTPDTITVKTGIPVQWNITAQGNVGCAGSLISRGLFPDTIYLTPDQTVTKEFTPPSPGTYRFSCSMGMYRGTIIVVDANGQTGSNQQAAAPVDSGAKGCGCSGGSTGTCGGPRN